MIKGSQHFDEMHISDISVICGSRPRGRAVDHSLGGRSSNGFLFILKGEATFYEAGERNKIVRKNELAYLPKQKKYRMKYSAESTDFVVVNFELRDMGGESRLLFPDIAVVARDDKSGFVARAMKNFELCSSSRTLDATLRKKELIYRLMGFVYSTDSYLKARDEGISQIAEGLRLLEQTYLSNLPVSAFAEASHVSLTTFRRLFQAQLGTSPLKYRNLLRLERAKELLLEGGFGVSEAAYASGFENVGYFCRYYRSVTGESPGETKKRLYTPVEEE